MSIKIEKQEKEGKCLLKVKGDMTIYDVQTLRNEMMDGFDAHNGLILDLEDVETCDVTGVQLIFSAKKSGEDQDKGFCISNVSASVMEAWVRMGLDAKKLYDKSRC